MSAGRIVFDGADDAFAEARAGLGVVEHGHHHAEELEPAEPRLAGAPAADPSTPREVSAVAELLSLDFMRQALVAALLVGIAAPLVGVFLVQRRLSLIGDGMGHVALAGVAVGVLTGTAPVLTALVAAVAAAVAIEAIRARGTTSGDVALAVMFYGGIAAGVVIIAKSPSGSPANLTAYLFGAITTASTSDLWVFAGLAVIVMGATWLLRPWFFAVANDEEYARDRHARHRAERRTGRADRRHRGRLHARGRPAPHQRPHDHPQCHRTLLGHSFPGLGAVGGPRGRGVQRRRGGPVVLRGDPLGRHDRPAGHRRLRRRRRNRSGHPVAGPPAPAGRGTRPRARRRLRPPGDRPRGPRGLRARRPAHSAHEGHYDEHGSAPDDAQPTRRPEEVQS